MYPVQHNLAMLRRKWLHAHGQLPRCEGVDRHVLPAFPLECFAEGGRLPLFCVVPRTLFVFLVFSLGLGHFPPPISCRAMLCSFAPSLSVSLCVCVCMRSCVHGTSSLAGDASSQINHAARVYVCAMRNENINKVVGACIFML